MATVAAAHRIGQSTAVSTSYERFAGACAILTGATGFLYSVAFVLLKSVPLQSVTLMVTGLLTTATLIAVYARLRQTDSSFALWAVVLGLTGGIGSAIHGGYDLANVLHPPAVANADLPSQIDPRGLLTFGVAGLALWLIAWLMLQNSAQATHSTYPRGLGYLGYLTAALLVVIYLARLIVLDATSLVVVLPALVAGFVASPAWYVWLGVSLWRGARA